MTGFSQFALGGLYADNNPLPITLLDFNVKCVNNLAKIDWSTASETNNDYFTVERSSNGKLFNPFVNVKAAGNSNTIKNYSVNDDHPSSDGITYYRLKQTDYNGKFKYFSTKSINCSNNNSIEPIIVTYPNPFNDIVSFNISNLKDNNINIQITDVLGNRIESKELNDLEVNNLILNFNLSKYKNGIYYYKFTSGSEINTGMIIKN